MADSDTIAAIATAPGEGGVAIIRVSGPRCFDIADAVFRCPAPTPSARAGGTFVAGQVIEADGTEIDEGILLVFRAPHSYTRDDTIEIQGHGGPVVARRILHRVLDAGARSAEPGEFTKRAFLNGRLDLVQAEAVLDLIRARSDRAAAAAAEQLAGALTRRFSSLYDSLLDLTANLEATLDFPDEELPPTLLDGIATSLRSQQSEMESLLSGWTEGHLLREGVRIAITGRPNVGKSTLLNALLGRDRAIVSDVPGTTRDLIEEGLVIGGYPIRLIDTAGIRPTDCAIEREGIRRATRQAAEADIVLHVIDVSQPIPDEDREGFISPPPRRVVVVANKMDLGRVAELGRLSGTPVVLACLKTGVGVHEVRREIVRALDGARAGSAVHAVISERHRALLQAARDQVASAVLELDTDGGDTALAADSLRSAMEGIGQITGREYSEELIRNIFSRFCIGK